MTMLSPSATYHAELRQELGSVGRALGLQRALVWVARGVAAGTIVVLGVVTWAWIKGTVSSLPLAVLIAGPVVAGLATGLASLFVRHNPGELARRVDRAARLSERSTTALELGARGAEFPLALAQMRDAVEHLKRVDFLEAFPLRLPKHELMATFFLVVIAAIVGLSPNPWLLRARAANPAITIAREQAQRVQRLADSIQPQGSPDLEALRQLVSKGARTIDAQSNQPDAALAALQDLEEQVRQMSAGDDQLASALAAIASALASDPATQQLASAINTGDMRQISQAAKDLAQATAGLSGQDKQRVAKVLRDAAGQAGRSSQNVAGRLSDAADAIQNAAAGAMASAAAGADQGQARLNGQPQSNGSAAQAATASADSAATDALNQLSNDAAAAGERARTASQLESSRNALERTLGRTQSRAGSTSSGNRSSSSSSSSGQSSQASSGGQTGDPSPSGTGSQGQGSGDGTDASGAGSAGADQGSGGDNNGQGGSGYSTGGQNQWKTAASGSRLDTITTPQQVPSNSPFNPDQSSANPYLADAGGGSAQTSQEAVQPSFSTKSTQGNDSGGIPLGLRDLVKDYFSSLDKKSP